MRVLLTGGTGMLGRAVLRYAPESDTYLIPSRHELDLTDRMAVRDYLSIHRPDAVIHCAGKVGGIAANMADPVGFMVNNILMSTHIIDESRRCGVPNLINIGSSCMYPRDFHGLLKESDILAGALEPTNEPYALAKISAAKLCAAITSQYGLAYRTFIPCNLYGVGDRYDRQTGHVMAAAIMKIHHAITHNQPSVEIWGDGTPRREFVFVDDVARFILMHINNLSSLPLTLNLGAGQDMSISELYHAVADVAGYKGNFTHLTSAPMGMNHKLMDINLARTHGWSPSTTLSSGIAIAYRDYAEQWKKTYDAA